MNYSKVRHVKSPERGTLNSAGIDFFVPSSKQNENRFSKDFLRAIFDKNENTNIFVNTDSNKRIAVKSDNLEVPPGERILIPSGIKVDLNSVFTSGEYDLNGTRVTMGVMLTAHNKSGVATKKGLDRLAEVVDSDYQGELHISVVNTGNEAIIIRPGDKLIQFILEPIFLNTPVEVPESDLFKQESERGEGGFGSTGNDSVSDNSSNTPFNADKVLETVNDCAKDDHVDRSNIKNKFLTLDEAILKFTRELEDAFEDHGSNGSNAPYLTKYENVSIGEIIVNVNFRADENLYGEFCLYNSEYDEHLLKCNYEKRCYENWYEVLVKLYNDKIENIVNFRLT